MSARSSISALVCAIVLAACGRAADPPSAAEPLLGIEEASGVARHGDELLIVGDHEAGTYYRARLADLASAPHGGRRPPLPAPGAPRPEDAA